MLWGEANSFLVLSTRSWKLNALMHDACTFDSIKLPTPSYLRQNFNISFKLQRFFKVESKKHAHKPWVFPRRQGWGFFVMLEFGVSFQEAAAAPQLFNLSEGEKCSSAAKNVRMQLKCEEATHAESEFPSLEMFLMCIRISLITHDAAANYSSVINLWSTAQNRCLKKNAK